MRENGYVIVSWATADRKLKRQKEKKSRVLPKSVMGRISDQLILQKYVINSNRRCSNVDA
ncbi:hypothetical protein GCM10028773_62260 [Spirosoma koreense]